MPHALALLSGGLDSRLAIALLQKQKIRVTAVAFETPFFDAKKAREAAENLGVPLRVVDFSDAHFEIVKNPPHGWGKNMNPCIDCHGLMFAFAGKIAREIGADFLASGEVLGQRPMSQNARALGKVAEISGIPGKILRPLSARLLPETEIETAGLVDRARLGAIAGRSRRPQMALAWDLGITDFPSPAGGCLLTDPGFSERLRRLLARDPAATPADARAIRRGRFVPLGARSFAAVGRDAAENLALRREPGDFAVELRDLAGPRAILRVKNPDDFDEIFPDLARVLKTRARATRDDPATEQIFTVEGGGGTAERAG